MPPATPSDIRSTIDAIWRMESAKLLASLMSVVRNLSLAEDLAQDALVAALQQWPEEGVPDHPRAWLMAAAKHKAFDAFRRSQMMSRKHEQILRELPTEVHADFDSRLDHQIDDDLLRLIFIACHPALPTEAQVALSLRLLGGLTTREIARAFLLPESTIAQRIVRAKRTLADERVAFELPKGTDLEQRLSAVLLVIYLIFNEGYSPADGHSWIKKDLYEEALRLGRILAGLLPSQPEVHGLVALMELQASRSNARVDSNNAPILLLDQDRSRWDRLLIHRGLAALERANNLSVMRGPYVLQAAIAACHARALDAAHTNWHRISELYKELANVTPSPIIELNRAVAVGMAYGPAAGLSLSEPLRSETSLANYHLLPSVRGDFLYKLERYSEARSEFERAALLAPTEREQKFLLSRAHACNRNQSEPLA